MSDKISPVAVVKEALAVSWARKWTFLGIWLLNLIPILFVFQTVGTVNPDPASFDPLEFPAMPVQLFSIVLVATGMSHLAVTFQPGEAMVCPVRFTGGLACAIPVHAGKTPIFT